MSTCCRSGERGSALFEVLAVGFMLTLLLSQAVVGVTRVREAGDRASTTAQTAALWAARSGDAADAAALAEQLAPTASVTAWRDGAEIHVVVAEEVSVIGPATGPLRYEVLGRAVASVSPYRSDG